MENQKIHPSAFIAPTATIIGDVEIGPDASVWYYAVIDGRNGPIKIGERSNVQDHCKLHVQSKGSTLAVGDSVVFGHSAVVSDSVIESEVLVGINSYVNGAYLEKNCIIAACAKILPGMKIKAGEMWAGDPGKLFRELNPEELNWARSNADVYAHLKDVHRIALKEAKLT